MDFSSFPRWHTLVLQYFTHPVLLCFGWSRTWSFCYAAPPAAFQLDLRRQPTSTNFNYRRSLGPKLFNVGNIAMYIIPFIYILPFTIINAKNVHNIHRVWVVCVRKHEILTSLHSLPGSENSSEVTNLTNLLQSDMIRRLGTVQALGEDILLNARYMSFGLMIFLVTLLCAFSSATWRIMDALWSQVRTLRECASRRRLLSAAINQNIRQETPAFEELTDQIYRCHQGSVWHSEVTESLWQSRLFEDRREDWEKVDELILKEKHASLRRYASNALCQAILVIVTASAYLSLIIITVTNALNVPLRTRLLDLQVIMIVWHNVIWNCGLGISLGVISCVMVFSPTPSPIQEEHALKSLYDEDS
ncbi:uncharacterized protein MELLADRAFT_71633 [Melampsora larici-populina 98AG31]|uniref:Uncharacterized protein n=1 Tax=Melampsora larici-populina (strain 98AG31 / pathotype 3-4-7) TaxID=747676 RepID=F4RIR9_MELLP|nr:uncharacterized protein MELLADRAFT_71633 [Melampsora larici-populina 98AG31]EGG07783.1 hypothetical protein MELLADRAFT_71633 [Melampsora larici-populina 98AG31]